MKKHIAITIVFASCLLFASCASNEHKKPLNIFEMDEVAALVNGDKTRQAEALKKYETAVRAFRKESNAGLGIVLFRESIETYPTPKAYFEMGNAFAINKEYESAIACYQIAEQMGFYPVSKIFYNIACAYSLLDKTTESARYLEYAVEAGYLNKLLIATDPDLANLRKFGQLSGVLETVWQGVDNPESVVWEGFLQSFTPAVLPLKLDLNTQKQLTENNYLGYNYEKYISEMHDREVFSRGTGNTYYAVNIVERNSEFITLVYAEETDIEMGALLPPCYFLASYSSKGTLIDKMLVGGQMKVENDSFRVCTINPNLAFELHYFNNTYKSVVDNESDGERLEVVSSTPAIARYYSIGTDGKFIETGPPLGAN